MLASSSRGLKTKAGLLLTKKAVKERQINAFEGNHPYSIVERPIGPVKVSFLTKLRNTGFAATRMPFLISQRQDLQQSPTTLRESTQLAC